MAFIYKKTYGRDIYAMFSILVAIIKCCQPNKTCIKIAAVFRRIYKYMYTSPWRLITYHVVRDRFYSFALTTLSSWTIIKLYVRTASFATLKELIKICVTANGFTLRLWNKRNCTNSPLNRCAIRIKCLRTWRICNLACDWSSSLVST